MVAGMGEVRAEGNVVHRGGRVATAEGRVTRADGKLVAHGTSTCMIVPLG
jgi:acyl-coenzyme A thioesterase PaaI-like protein